MTNQSDKNKPVSSYILFGIYLQGLRKKRGIRSEQMAEYLGITLSQYKEFEDGVCLPDDRTVVKLARILDVTVAEIKERMVQAARKNSNDTSIKIPELYSVSDQSLPHAWERVKKKYFEKTGKELTDSQKRIFGAFKRQLYRVFFPPILPFPAAIFLDSIRRNKPHCKYLHEIVDFVLHGETLAGFLARDNLWAPFALSKANLFFFKESPATNFLDCMNRLTIDQFEIIFLVGIVVGGVYTNELELPDLCKHSEFSSRGVLLARALKAHLPSDINFDHLEMVVLLQGVGHHVLYTCLQPSTRNGAEIDKEDPETSVSDLFYGALDEQLFTDMNYELHPVVSAVMATRWNFPKQVVDVLLEHHEKPTENMSPLCAMLKIINFFSDLDFPAMQEEDLKDWMSAYPQVKISPEALFSALVKLNRDKANFIERSSTMAAAAHRDVAKYLADKTGEKPIIETSDFFRNPDFLKVVSTACLILVEAAEVKFFLARENEPMEKYLERIKLFQIFLDYAQYENLHTVAAKLGMTEEEIAKILKLR